MSEHTPGPWHNHGLHIHAEYTVDGKNHHHHVAEAQEVSDEYSDVGTGKGNVEFIVRACNAHDDLVQAAKAIVDAQINGTEADYVAAFEATKTAITKAEEGTP